MLVRSHELDKQRRIETLGAGLSEEQMVPLIDLYMKHPDIFFEENIIIEDKKQRLIPFVMNYAQRLCLEGLGQWNLILKARQMGFSTFILALFLLEVMNTPNANALIVSHDKESTQKLFKRLKSMYERMDPEFKQPAKYDNKNELFFKQINSTIRVGTAGSTAVGRGDTISHLHLSEVAFYQNTTFLTGLMEALTPNARVFVESTANGIGNLFHKMVQRAKNGEGKYKYFCFRYEHPEYEVFDEDRIQNYKYTKQVQKKEELYELTPEPILKKRGVTIGQLLWRRDKIASMPKPEEFIQEYLEDDVQCFIMSGRRRFKARMMQRYLEGCEDPEIFEFKSQFSGKVFDVSVWEAPKVGAKYVLGSDVAEGKVHGDYSVVKVYRKPKRPDEKMVEVAKYRGHPDEEFFGEIQACLAIFYNNAFCVPEVNFSSYATHTLKKLYSPSRIYHRQQFDKAIQESTDLIGWYTDGTTKPFMIGQLDVALINNRILIRDAQFVDECFSYEVDDKGRTNAVSGAFDDNIIASALALQGCMMPDYAEGNVT